MSKVVWKKEEVKLLVIKVFKAVKRGLPIEVGFEWTAAKLPNKTISNIHTLWYTKLNHKYKEKLEFYRKTTSQYRYHGGSWTTKEDFKVIMAVKESVVTGQTLESLLRKLAPTLDRTYSSVMTRWYKTLSKNEKVKKDIEEFKLTIMREAV